jgi:hypothetical protein
MAVYLSKINGFALNHKRLPGLCGSTHLILEFDLNDGVPLSWMQQTKPQSLWLISLIRDFSSTSLVKKLVTDMTFIQVVEGWLVLSTVKDLLNHKIVAWETAPSATLQLALNTIKK